MAMVQVKLTIPQAEKILDCMHEQEAGGEHLLEIWGASEVACFQRAFNAISAATESARKRKRRALSPAQS